MSSTRLINHGQGETDRLTQGRFFDRALQTVKENVAQSFVSQKFCGLYLNPVKAGLVSHGKDWLWPSVSDYPGSLDRPAKTAGILAVGLFWLAAWRFLLPAEERTRI